MKKTYLLLAVLLVFIMAACAPALSPQSTPNSGQLPPSSEPDVAYKPVIYLYPQEEMQVSVNLDLNGEFLFTYPAYNDGWNVTAYPDGTIISDGNEYSYLFWEGELNTRYDFSEGFVVRGEDTEAFLVEKLQYLGLTPKEYNEFIVFWLPQMVNNNYNLITFQDDLYTVNAALEISPQPDSIQRVFMAYKALEERVEIPPQELVPFVRSGFTVIEWGGTEVSVDTAV